MESQYGKKFFNVKKEDIDSRKHEKKEKGLKKANECKEKPAEYPAHSGINKTNGEMKGKEMEKKGLTEMVGGQTTVDVPICSKCGKRIAVHQMNLCAVCYVKSK